MAGIVSNANKKHGNACRIIEIPRMAMGGSEAEIFNYDNSFEAVCNGMDALRAEWILLAGKVLLLPPSSRG